MKKILVIEDNLDVRENIAEILELSNFEVVQAVDGKNGTALAISEQPNLIICDVMMPEMDGFSVLRMLSRNHKTMDIPFIFLTAKSEREDMRKGMSLGADDYITKPFTDIELLDAIEIRFQKSERLKKSFDGTFEGLENFVNESRGKRALFELSEKRTSRKYKKKEFLIKEGENPNHLYFINAGRIKTFKQNDFGKELITSIAGPGDFLGYLSLIKESNYVESATAMEPSEVSLIPKKEFLALIHGDRDVSSQLIRMLAKNISEKEERLLRLAYDSVRKRVADALIRVALKSGITELKPGAFYIRRLDLANIAGTTKETCIRTLADFKEEKLIEMDLSKINIIGWTELKNLPN